MLGQRNRFKGYQAYVENGIDEDLERFYNKGNVLSVLGNSEFKTQKKEMFDETDIIKLRQLLEDKPTIEEMLLVLTSQIKVSKNALCKKQEGRYRNHPLRLPV